MKTSHQRTYDQVFQHPMTHNLEWRDIRAMFEDLGSVETEHNGNVKLTVSGRSVVFHSPTLSDVATTEQVSQIRHLLQSSSEYTPTKEGQHLLLVIDHQDARIYRTQLRGTIPEHVLPFDPDGHKSHVHSAHNFPGQPGQPHEDAYFSAVAKSLLHAQKILIFGSGTGSSSTMDLFVAYLNEHEPKIADCVIGHRVVDDSHLSEGQLLATAREAYAEILK